ncbi:MAG: MFS transporter [Patescibacteria group bacterium]
MAKKKAWLPLTEPEKILFWSSNIWALADGMLGPLFAVFAQQLGGDILSITWAWATFLVVTAVGTLAVGKMGDMFGGHHTLSVMGYFTTAFFTFGYLLVTTPFELFVVQAGLGLGLALSNPTWYALYDRYSGTGKHDGLVWGFATAGGQIAQACAIMIGGLIVTHFSFATLFTIMGTLSLCAAFWQAKILRYAAR